jgi:hypothetical protein
MKSLPIRLLVVLTAAVFVWGVPGPRPAAAQEDGESVHDLRPRWVEGRVTRYRFETRRSDDMSMSVNDQNREATTVMQSSGEMTWTVQEVRDDGSARVTLVYDWLKLSFTPPQGEAQAGDSREAGGFEPLKDLCDAVAGSPLTVTFAADGSVDKLEGYEAIKEKAEFPEGVPGRLDFLESVTDKICLPGAPAEAESGDAWEQQFAWNHRMGKMAYDTTYELVGVEPMAGIPVATIRSESELELEVNREDMPPDAPPIDTNMESASASEDVLFDLSRNEVVGRYGIESYMIRININAPQAQVNQRITQTVTHKLLRIEER